jgi:hypothetical protein
MQGRYCSAAVKDRDLHQDVFRPGFCIFNKNVEVFVFPEDAGILQLIFRVFPAAALIFLQQFP